MRAFARQTNWVLWWDVDTVVIIICSIGLAQKHTAAHCACPVDRNMATAGDPNPPDPGKKVATSSREGGVDVPDHSGSQQDHLITEIESSDGHLGSTLRWNLTSNVPLREPPLTSGCQLIFDRVSYFGVIWDLWGIFVWCKPCVL